jgi:hypothetical protein
VLAPVAERPDEDFLRSVLSVVRMEQQKSAQAQHAAVVLTVQLAVIRTFERQLLQAAPLVTCDDSITVLDDVLIFSRGAARGPKSAVAMRDVLAGCGFILRPIPIATAVLRL